MGGGGACGGGGPLWPVCVCVPAVMVCVHSVDYIQNNN